MRKTDENGKFVGGEFVPADQVKRSAGGVSVIGDIEPYRSVATGEVIGGRRQHREHLRSHGLTEVGNEQLSRPTMPDLPGLRQDLQRTFEEMK